jgi:hypothetical protein
MRLIHTHGHICYVVARAVGAHTWREVGDWLLCYVMDTVQDFLFLFLVFSQQRIVCIAELNMPQWQLRNRHILKHWLHLVFRLLIRH